ncbi:hypothetical protein AB0399_05285 [Streptomyces sp. NPDC088194]|uniref:hypothetical protein n=1 Tax=Streptomyces sp. NPDC088194 TaxID=3154931 RepID=UPI00344CFF5D
MLHTAAAHYLSGPVAGLKARLVASENANGDLPEFRAPALARLSARHEEIVHLRATLTQARPVTRPPAARTTVIGSCG